MKLKVIYGAPCSGKSTYVRKNITEKDIVYDYDELTRALTYRNKRSAKKDLTHDYVLDFKLVIIRKAREEQNIENIYIISTLLTDTFRKWVSDLDPEYIKMEATREECLSRLENDEMRPDKEEWASKINEWFDTYERKRRKIRETIADELSKHGKGL